jgi:hypothetical protein
MAGGVAIEMGRREADPFVVRKQRFLRPEVLDVGAKDRPVGRSIPKCLEVRAPEGTFPHEKLVSDAPLTQVT